MGRLSRLVKLGLLVSLLVSDLKNTVKEVNVCITGPVLHLISTLWRQERM